MGRLAAAGTVSSYQMGRDKMVVSCRASSITGTVHHHQRRAIVSRRVGPKLVGQPRVEKDSTGAFDNCPVRPLYKSVIMVIPRNTRVVGTFDSCNNADQLRRIVRVEILELFSWTWDASSSSNRGLSVIVLDGIAVHPSCGQVLVCQPVLFACDTSGHLVGGKPVVAGPRCSEALRLPPLR